MSFLTLIELYDERPIENVLASETFRPERTVFLCPPAVAGNETVKRKLAEFFRRRGLDTVLEFIGTGLYSSEVVLGVLRSVISKYGDCMIDITGGTDDALFACGQLCADTDVPVVTYSRRKSRFFNIKGAEFADDMQCDVSHSVEDCIAMAGGAVRMGRVDNSVLGPYEDKIVPFFNLYLKNRVSWTKTVKYFQITSQNSPLSVKAAYTVKGDRGENVDVPASLLCELEKIGFLSGVSVSKAGVSYTFADSLVRSWLRDIGAVLELYVYKKCLDTGVFGDVRVSTVVDWEGDGKQGNVTNEIDVVAVKGIMPAFISCKTCAVSTEALNELAVLRDRFGGQIAKAAIVTSRHCQTITRHRAAELGIDVIDLEDLKGDIVSHLRAMMRTDADE